MPSHGLTHRRVFILVVGGKPYEQSRDRYFLEIPGYELTVFIIWKAYEHNRPSWFALAMLLTFVQDMLITRSNGGFAALWSTDPTALTVVLTLMVFPHVPYLPMVLQVTKVCFFYAIDGKTMLADTAEHYLFCHIAGVLLAGLGIATVLRSRVEAEQRLRGNLERRREFLTCITHELRTPISGAIGNIELCERDELPSSQACLLDNALVCSRSALDLMDRLLQWSKMASKVSLNSHFKLSALCDDARAIVGQQMAAKGLSFDIVCRKDCTVFQDRGKICQIVTNLIWNATKYTPEGGSVRLVAYVEQDGTIVYEVNDTGIGLEETEIRTIFLPFRQLNEKSEGIGLGLAIARDLTRSLGGTCDVASPGKGKGTTFRLRFRQPSSGGGLSVIEPARETSVFRRSSSSSSTEEDNLPQKHKSKNDERILIVEDTEMLANLFEKQLRRLGYSVIFKATSGIEAIRFLEENSVTVVFSDLMMPGGLDGFELCMLIRHKGLKCRVFAVTALTDSEFVSKGKTVGFTGYLTKPVRLQALQNALDQKT